MDRREERALTFVRCGLQCDVDAVRKTETGGVDFSRLFITGPVRSGWMRTQIHTCCATENVRKGLGLFSDISQSLHPGKVTEVSSHVLVVLALGGCCSESQPHLQWAAEAVWDQRSTVKLWKGSSERQDVETLLQYNRGPVFCNTFCRKQKS